MASLLFIPLKTRKILKGSYATPELVLTVVHAQGWQMGLHGSIRVGNWHLYVPLRTSRIFSKVRLQPLSSCMRHVIWEYTGWSVILDTSYG